MTLYGLTNMWLTGTPNNITTLFSIFQDVRELENFQEVQIKNDMKIIMEFV